MDNKPFTIFDNLDTKDNASIKGTYIILKETGTGKPLFRGHNKVIVSGSEFNAIKDFNFDDSWNTQGNFLNSIPSYDEGLAKTSATSTTGHPLDTYNSIRPVTNGILSAFSGMNANTDNKLHDIYKYFTRRVYLFCVGIDGCGIEASRVYKVQNTKWIAPYMYSAYDPGTGIIDTNITNCLIPFKVKTTSTDLTSEERKKYFGRSTVYDGKNHVVSYYFKAFDQAPTLIRRYADDSSLLDNVDDVWADSRKSEAEVVVQLKMTVSTTDCREYFNFTTGTNTSKLNTISLCTAIPYIGKDPDGSSDTNTDRLFYKDIRPFTKFNFPNEALISATKGLDITYYLYY